MCFMACLAYFYVRYVEAVCSSETSISLYQATWLNLPENNILDIYRRETLKSYLN